MEVLRSTTLVEIKATERSPKARTEVELLICRSLWADRLHRVTWTRGCVLLRKGYFMKTDLITPSFELHDLVKTFILSNLIAKGISLDPETL